MNDMSLAAKMIAIADRDGLPADHLMRIRAEELERVNLDARSLLGAWARARHVYCDYTGEPLI
jgi:hypothetical protein